jgi:RNA polymerase sigma-70 factor (ECF subfamily)
MTRERYIDMVRTEQEPLRRFLLALCCGNRDEADDIAQDTLVKAYLSMAQYEERGKAAAWLYRIAYHLFVDTSRRRRTLQPVEVLDKQEDASFAADRDFRYQALYMALEALPPKERTAILLFYIKGYAVKEIAEIVEATEDAVKKQLSRGRSQLKTLLKDE